MLFLQSPVKMCVSKADVDFSDPHPRLVSQLTALQREPRVQGSLWISLKLITLKHSVTSCTGFKNAHV